MNDLRAGVLLGKYELLVRIGRGGMASVWVARERSPASNRQRLVALKAMLPELAARSHFRSMFLQEGQIVRSIDHQNVVQVYEVAEASGVLYMAMEWVEGDSLRAVIQQAARRRPIPAEYAVRIIADVAGGLHAAHELRGWDGELRGIVHCDVSPHNILVGVDGRSKLVDFGVASAVQQLDTEERSNNIAGKFSYMSPEQAQGRRIDRRSDIFSLGVVLYELTTGQRLFKADSADQTLAHVLGADIVPPRALDERYPEGLQAIVLRALERDPTARYQTADELRRALERYLIDERVMVAHASVGQLLRRVVGARIEKRRQLIRAVLRSIDGELVADVVPEQPVTEASRAFGDLSLSTGVTGATRASEPSAATHSTPAARPSLTSTALEHVVAIASPARTRLRLLAFGAAAALLGLGVVWAYRSGSNTHAPVAAAAPTAPDPTPPARSAPAARADAERGSPGAGAVSVDSLPLATAESERRRRAPPHAGRPAPRPPPPVVAAPAEPHAAAEVAETPPPVIDVQLDPQGAKPGATAEPAAEMQARPPPEVVDKPNPYREQLEEPSGPRGRFNQSAAIAALGRAASAANGCRAADGPSGSGSATVTLSPNGRVSAVALAAPFAGTDVGRCVAGKFRSASVPAFTGSAVTLSKGFYVAK